MFAHTVIRRWSTAPARSRCGLRRYDSVRGSRQRVWGAWGASAGERGPGRGGVRGARRLTGGDPRSGGGVPRRDPAGRRRPEGPVRRWRLGRRPPIPARLLHRHRAPVRDRTARRGATPVPRRVRSVAEQLRRVPRADDVLHARRGLGLGRRRGTLLLGQRAPPRRLCGRCGELPLPGGSAPRAVVRAGSDLGPPGVRELGPARGRPGGGGDPRVLPPPRRMGGSPDRSGYRGEGLSWACCSSPSRPNGCEGGSRIARSSCGGRPC